jgi:hypothetical protein
VLLVPRERPVHADPGILHRLLGVLLVGQHAAGEAETARMVVPNELGERTEVAPLRSRNDARVEYGHEQGSSARLNPRFGIEVTVRSGG